MNVVESMARNAFDADEFGMLELAGNGSGHPEFIGAWVHAYVNAIGQDGVITGSTSAVRLPAGTTEDASIDTLLGARGEALRAA